MKLIIYDNVRYLLSSGTEEAIGEFHRQLPQIKADIEAMRATQLFDQKNWIRKDGWRIQERFGETTVVYDSKIEKKKDEQKLKEEEQFTLQFPIPVIDVFSSGYNLMAFDITKDYVYTVCPVIPRYQEIVDGNTEIDINAAMRDIKYHVSDLERVDDDDINQEWHTDYDYETDGYSPYPAGGLVWPSWFTCAFCGGIWSECSPTDIGVRGAYHYADPGMTGAWLSYAQFGNFEDKCSDDQEIAVWWNFYSICAPSGIIRTELGVGSVIGAGSWTSQEARITIAMHTWTESYDTFIGENSRLTVREFYQRDDCAYHSWAENLDVMHPVSFKSSDTVSTYTNPNIIDGRIWTEKSKYIYLWQTLDFSGAYSRTQQEGSLTYFIRAGINSCYYPSGINDTAPFFVYVTTDEGIDYVVFEYPSNSANRVCYGYTRIYDFHGTPFYMYSAWTGNYATYPATDMYACYGFIYSGDHHRIIFDATDYEEHPFVSAKYISPTGVEKTVVFNQEQYANLIGNMQFRGAKFSSTELRERK